jgi:tRNA A-37 threonylcarbamoyl transferase component Bud32
VSERLHINPDLRSSLPDHYGAFTADPGETIARSLSSATTKIDLGGTPLVRKRYVYSLRTALKAALRNTLLRPSRAEREYRMLRLFRERLGDGAVPTPVAFGERRCLLLLREALLLTIRVREAVPLSSAPADGTVPAVELGGFLAGLHGAGLVHGSLFARNVLFVAGGGFRLLDLDHAQALSPERLPPLSSRARDLAFLAESLPFLPEFGKRALQSYASETGEGVEDLVRAVARHRPEARARLARRSRVRPPGRSAE